jgi:hypothetical protein
LTSCSLKNEPAPGNSIEIPEFRAKYRRDPEGGFLFIIRFGEVLSF